MTEREKKLQAEVELLKESLEWFRKEVPILTKEISTYIGIIAELREKNRGLMEAAREIEDYIYREYGLSLPRLQEAIRRG